MTEDAASRASLIVGNRIRCPKDGILRNMLAYKTFEITPEHADELNPVLRCPDCRHVFSPGRLTSELRSDLQRAAEAVVLGVG